jgi:hypothetical protein
MKVYMDVCCLNRPFDDPLNTKERHEWLDGIDIETIVKQAKTVRN